jgi:hypothetical protein
MQTEFEFTLPIGYLDEMGQRHQHGRMRLATAVDEIEAVEHPHVREKESYLPVLLLGRVVTQLGSVTAVTPQIIANLFAADLAYLQDLYLQINSGSAVLVTAECPHCQHQFQLKIAPIT